MFDYSPLDLHAPIYRSPNEPGAELAPHLPDDPSNVHPSIPSPQPPTPPPPPPPPPDVAWTSDLNGPELEDQLRSTAAELAAGTHRFLLLIAEFDRRELWHKWECRSAAHWLSWQCGLGLPAAREHVRVARRLEELPAVSQALATGSLSYSKARAITRIADASMQDHLIQLAGNATAEQLERICATLRRQSDLATEDAALRDNELRAEERAFLRWSRTPAGELVGSFRLPPAAGDVLLAALAAATDEGPEEHADDPFNRRRARALELLASSFLAGPDSESRSLPEVVVHVDLANLATLSLDSDSSSNASRSADANNHRLERPLVSTNRGTKLSASALARIISDSGVRYVADYPDGTQLNLGRHQRTVSPALFRALKARDQHCQFPGCASTKRLHAHHIIWWSHGGQTNPTNLVLLCAKHHHAIHDRRWTCTGPAKLLRFFDPEGQEVTTRTQPPHVSAETLRTANRRRVHKIANSAGGQAARESIDWACLFAAFNNYLPLRYPAPTNVQPPRT